MSDIYTRKVVDTGEQLRRFWMYMIRAYVYSVNMPSLVCYKKYADQIDTFLSYVAEGKSIKEEDVLAAWEITTPSALTGSI